MTRLLHPSISTDIDRFDDGTLRTMWWPLVEHFGGIKQLREACREARAAGLIVFPSCNNAGPNGLCQGHPVDDEAIALWERSG